MVSNDVVNDIPETFSAMELGVKVIKLHVRSCVYRLKYLSDTNFMESSD